MAIQATDASCGAALAEAEDVDLVRPRRGSRACVRSSAADGRGAELGLLDGAARGADEMVVVTGVAAHVGRAAVGRTSGAIDPVWRRSSIVR